MSKKQAILDAVYAQHSPFYSSTILSLSGSSTAMVSNTLNELLSQGVISCSRDGKRMVYILTSSPKQEVLNIEGRKVIEEHSCSIQEKFDYIREIVRMVIGGVNSSALITGRPGVGKTHLVKEELCRAGLEKDTDFLFFSGYTSSFGLYKLLHDHRDQFLVLDDFDSCFKDQKSVSILKAALDSYDTRRVDWVSDRTERSEDIESSFEFTGKIIFISNIYASRIDEAICSRSLCIDLRLTNDEVTEHMGNLINLIEPKVSVELKREVLDFISSISNCFNAYGLRTFMQAIRIRVGAGPNTDWRKMIKLLSV